MTDDIVARLRLWSDNAKEQDATEIVVGLCQAADEIERLRAERDEARREVCELSARCVRADYFLQIKNPTHTTPQDVAESRGWDCFKKEDEQ